MYPSFILFLVQDDDGGDLMAAIESLSDKALAQFVGRFLKGILG